MFFAFMVVAAGPTTERARGLGSSMVAMTVAAITPGLVGGWIVDQLGARVALTAGEALLLGCWCWGLASTRGLWCSSIRRRRRCFHLRNWCWWRRCAGTHASLFALQFSVRR
jgi:hypothetical protein